MAKGPLTSTTHVAGIGRLAPSRVDPDLSFHTLNGGTHHGTPRRHRKQYFPPNSLVQGPDYWIKASHETEENISHPNWTATGKAYSGPCSLQFSDRDKLVMAFESYANH